MFEIDLHNQVLEWRPRRRRTEACIARTWLNQKPPPELPIQTLAEISEVQADARASSLFLSKNF